MEMRTRSQNAALKFFKNTTSARTGSPTFRAGVDAILASACLRPLARAKALLKAERRRKLTVSSKPVSREELEIVILQFTAKHGSPDPALVHLTGREAPIAEARRLADDNNLTATSLSELLQLMLDCVGLWHPLDVKRAKEWAARKLCKPEADPRYTMTSQGYSIPLSVALAEPMDAEALPHA